MRLQSLLVLLLFCLISCQEKKNIVLTGEEPVPAAEFIDFFAPFSLPHTIADTVLNDKLADSVRISIPVLRAMIPDSVYDKEYNKKSKPVFYALGKVEVPDAEKYVFIRATSSEKRMIWILAFDQQNNFRAATALLKPPSRSSIQQSLVMDRKYLLSQIQLRKNPDGSASEGKEVFVLNEAAGRFMLIMTEALEDKPTELINPIDTLTASRKYSADYTNGKMNLVSIRDGRKTDRFTFFIHFEKREGNCMGELKGEAIWKSPTRAEYRQAGDPCVLQFYFTSSGIRLQEQNCGSRRNTGCLFDGSYVRKKSPRFKRKG
jgi:hypothetical protein